MAIVVNSGSKKPYYISALMKAARIDIELIVAAMESVNAEMYD